MFVYPCSEHLLYILSQYRLYVVDVVFLRCYSSLAVLVTGTFYSRLRPRHPPYKGMKSVKSISNFVETEICYSEVGLIVECPITKLIPPHFTFYVKYQCF